MDKQSSSRRTTGRVPSKAVKPELKRSQAQKEIDPEVERFANYVYSEAFVLVSRTNAPGAIIKILAAAVGMITAKFIAKPPRSERSRLARVMATLTIAFNGNIVVEMAELPREQQT